MVYERSRASVEKESRVKQEDCVDDAGYPQMSAQQHTSTRIMPGARPSDVGV
jgi:hypothetical protein